MTAYSAEEFYQRGINALSSFPTIAAKVQAGDVRVLAQLRAQATMLAMLSEQSDVAQYEPFNKARDSTVLADASLKGILPLARCSRVRLRVDNQGASTYALAAGRRLMDPKGRSFIVDADASIAAGGFAMVNVTQKSLRTITHSVVSPSAFYSIEVTAGQTDVYLSNISVWRGVSEFAYRPDWVNLMPGDLAYNLETDELRRLWVRFGSSDVIGTGVQTGDVYELRLVECEGRITDLTAGLTFTPEYLYTEADGLLKITLDSVLDEGADPLSMADLRVMSQYPAVYDHNAVYLGEFDLLLRRYMSPIRFLAVWNEQIEESVRGASTNNINTLFVSGEVIGMTNAAFESGVRSLVARADNSYRVTFKAVSRQAVPITVDCQISVVHDIATVEAQIRAALLDQYGENAVTVSKGMSNPLKKQATSKLLKAAVPALQDDRADFNVAMTLPSTPLPEHFLYLTNASITVNVTRAGFGSGPWSTY